MTHLCVLNQKDWNSLYSKDLYTKVRKKDPSISKETRMKVVRASAEYFIAFEQSDNYIMKFVEGKLKKDSSFLKKTFNRYDLTLLDLAIMKNRVTLAEKLIDKGANLKSKDFYGWFPIHHAALASDKMFELIIRKGGKVQAKTRFDGTCADLREMVGLEDSTRSTKTLFVLNEKGEKVPFSIERDLIKLGMEKFTDTVYFPPDKLQKLWKQTLKPHRVEEREKMFENALNEASQSPPKLLLKSSPALGGGQKKYGAIRRRRSTIRSGCYPLFGKIC